MVSTSRRTDKKTLYLVSADSINVGIDESLVGEELN